MIVLTEEIIIGLLLIAAVVSVITQRLRIPYTIGVVLTTLLVGGFVSLTTDYVFNAVR